MLNVAWQMGQTPDSSPVSPLIEPATGLPRLPRHWSSLKIATRGR
jgi:hypothetical protein